MNRFVELISSGSINSERELKRAFWRIAKDCHPDSGGSNASEEEFAQLKKEFDEARLTMKSRNSVTQPADNLSWDRDACPVNC